MSSERFLGHLGCFPIREQMQILVAQKVSGWMCTRISLILVIFVGQKFGHLGSRVVGLEWPWPVVTQKNFDVCGLEAYIFSYKLMALKFWVRSFEFNYSDFSCANL